MLRKWGELRLAQVQVVDVQTNLDTGKANLLAVLHLDGQIRVLHGHGAEVDVVFRMVVDRLSHVIVEVLRNFELELRIRPVADQHGDGADDLHLRFEFFVFGDTGFGVPAVLLDPPEELLPFHHVRKARLIVLQVDEIAVAKFVCPAGQFGGHDVGVHVDFEHGSVALVLFKFWTCEF